MLKLTFHENIIGCSTDELEMEPPWYIMKLISDPTFRMDGAETKAWEAIIWLDENKVNYHYEWLQIKLSETETPTMIYEYYENVVIIVIDDAVKTEVYFKIKFSDVFRFEDYQEILWQTICQREIR